MAEAESVVGIAKALPSQVSEMCCKGEGMRMQARIAMVNTALTAAGMWALAIPGVGLLSLFVFICSFIPIAGCFISTVPVAFVALTEYGFLKVRSLRPWRIPHMLSCALHKLLTSNLPTSQICKQSTQRPLCGDFHCQFWTCTNRCMTIGFRRHAVC